MLRDVAPSLAILLLMSAVSPGSVSAQRDSQALLELVNKGYVNLLIAISERVPDDPGLLDRIQFVLTETSKFLFQATRGRAYFKDVHILVPGSWSDSEDYSNVRWQRYDQSDIIIDTPSETTGNRPYVNKPTPCGEPGLFIHLTPDYLLSQSIASRYGTYEKALVHEWAHYRWGVFDEYPLNNGQHFYADADGNIEAVRCVSSIQGRRVKLESGNYEPCENDANGLPEKDCRFLDDASGGGYTGSLMYKQFLPGISTFCEKSANGVLFQGNVHNREAPNIQNTQCQGRSIWEVMLQHRDFAPRKGENDVNGGGSLNGGNDGFDGEPVPEFTVVKKRSSRLVLVLDTSGSMKGQRLRQLRQAAEFLINQILMDGEQLGIVQFSGRGVVKSGLLPISDDNRQRLLNNIPNVADGPTSIASGIDVGLGVLKGRAMSLDAAAGGKLLVITDGEENTAPYIADILPLVNGSGVTIDTFAIGVQASSSLELLSSVTGGTTYNLKEETNSLSDAFSKSSTTDKDITSTPVSLYMEFVMIPPGQHFTGAVFVDSTIGRNTQFLYGHSSASDSISVRLTDPDGTVLTEGSPEYHVNTDFQQIRIAIGGNAKIGSWEFKVQNNLLSSKQNVTILVQSHAREGQDPIVVKSQWGFSAVVPPQRQSLYVSVGQGYTPVVDGEVTAVVDLPCGSGNDTVTMHPKDDGIGADVRKDDGVYSAFFTEFCSEGRYGVNVEVNNKGRATSIASGSIIGVSTAVNPEYTGDGEEYQPVPVLRSTGDFRRVTIGGSFKCEESQFCNGSLDLYPPARITDLMASNVDVDTMQVELTFTAPGDDLTTGKASRYFIVMSRSVSDIYDNFEAVSEIPSDSYLKGDVTMTKYSGETEVFVIRVAQAGQFSYSFAVVAVDDEGNRSEPSNVATSSARDFRKTPRGLIIGLSVGGALLLILIIVVFVMMIRRKKKAGGKETPETSWHNNNGSVEEGGHSRQVERNVYANGDLGLVNPSGEMYDGGNSGHQVGKGPQVSGVKVHQVDGVRCHQEDPDSPMYEGIISRRDKDPNWDPTLPNNSEGGGANIKTGYVANAKAKFDNIGFLK